MANKSTTPEKLYSILELSEIMGIAKQSVQNKIYRRRLFRVKKVGQFLFYSKDQLNILQKPKHFIPVETPGFKTYQSKLNTL
jgi:hypothetical protein